MLIEITQLQFCYRSAPDKTILTIPHWQLPQRKNTFLYGPSGVGKSTFLTLLCGLLTGYQGTVSVLGQPLHLLSARQRDGFRARQIGYVFQQFNLIPFLHAVDNLQLAATLAKKHTAASLLTEIKTLLSALGLPQSVWYQPVTQLSIGQQQRVAIARALINRPALLIADEPTSSLDPANRDQFMTLLFQQAAMHDTTVLMVSHDLALAEDFDQQLAFSELSHGSIEAC